MEKPALTPAYCERQYNARAAIPEHAEIFARWSKRSQEARARLRCELDLSYGPRSMEKLDLFHSLGPSRGLFMFIQPGHSPDGIHSAALEPGKPGAED